MVITNTFHGTIFSMNFQVPFYSCCVQPGSRQGQMLAMCGLEERIINSPGDLMDVNDWACDFSASADTISRLRKKSIEYLENALNS